MTTRKLLIIVLDALEGTPQIDDYREDAKKLIERAYLGYVSPDLHPCDLEEKCGRDLLCMAALLEDHRNRCERMKRHIDFEELRSEVLIAHLSDPCTETDNPQPETSCVEEQPGPSGTEMQPELPEVKLPKKCIEE